MKKPFLLVYLLIQYVYYLFCYFSIISLVFGSLKPFYFLSTLRKNDQAFCFFHFCRYSPYVSDKCSHINEQTKRPDQLIQSEQ